jgi:hypothetical protein
MPQRRFRSAQTPDIQSPISGESYGGPGLLWYAPKKFEAFRPCVEWRIASIHRDTGHSLSYPVVSSDYNDGGIEDCRLVAHQAAFAHPVRFRRRHQARMPPLAKIRPGRPAPAMGPEPPPRQSAFFGQPKQSKPFQKKPVFPGRVRYIGKLGCWGCV